MNKVCLTSGKLIIDQMERTLHFSIQKKIDMLNIIRSANYI